MSPKKSNWDRKMGNTLRVQKYQRSVKPKEINETFSSDDELPTNKERAGFTYNSVTANQYERKVDVGQLKKLCTNCKAVQRPKKVDTFCCLNGKIKLPTLQEPPTILSQLLNGEHDKSTMFLNNM